MCLHSALDGRVAVPGSALQCPSMLCTVLVMCGFTGSVPSSTSAFLPFHPVSRVHLSWWPWAGATGSGREGCIAGVSQTMAG